MILIITPIQDIPTSISYFAGKDLVNFCDNNKLLYKTLAGAEAYRAIFESTMLFNKNINLICYYGHGLEDGLLGQHIISNMCDKHNNHYFNRKIVYTMACWTGTELAPNTIQKGGLSYFGSTNWFYGAIPNEEYDYFSDWLNYITIIPKGLMNGLTCQQALDQYKDLINKYLNKYKNNKYSDWDWYYHSTKSNMDYFKLFGDKGARLWI